VQNEEKQVMANTANLASCTLQGAATQWV